MIKEGIKSIKNDFAGSLFYWLTFVLTSMFMFLYFHLSYSDAVGVTFINSENNMSTFMSVLVIAVCMIVIFFANNFYVKRKSKELSIQLVCGATFMQITVFLLFQTVFLFILAVPVGLLIGTCLMPLINYVLYALLDSDIFLALSMNAVISTFIIIACEILWCTVLNIGFSYRSSIKDLMLGGNDIKVKMVLPFQLSVKISKAFHLCLYLLPILLIYFNSKDTSAVLVLSIIGMFGLSLCFKSVFIPMLNKMVQDKYISRPRTVVYLGLLRNDLLLMKSNIILLVVSSIVLISILVSSLKEPMDVMLAMISFVVINVLLSLAVMFKFSSELANRKKYFLSLSRLGYMKYDLKLIMKKEVLLLYCAIAILSLSYILNIFIVLIIHQLLDIKLIMFMLVSFIIPLVLCGLTNYIYYEKIVYRE